MKGAQAKQPMTSQSPRRPPATRARNDQPSPRATVPQARSSHFPFQLSTNCIKDGSNIPRPHLNTHAHTLNSTNAHVPQLRLPTTLLLPALLHPPTSRQHALLPTSLLVHAHPILLPPQPHLHPLPHRRAPHPALHKHHAATQPLPARRKSHHNLHGLPRRRQPR